MALNIRAGGSWLPAKAVRVRVGGTWTPAKTVRQRVAGVWKIIWTSLSGSCPPIVGTDQPAGSVCTITGGTAPYTFTSLTATPNPIGGGGQPLIYNSQDVIWVTYVGIGSGTVVIQITDSAGATATVNTTYDFTGGQQENGGPGGP
jgi:hypothetical protein